MDYVITDLQVVYEQATGEDSSGDHEFMVRGSLDCIELTRVIGIPRSCISQYILQRLGSNMKLSGIVSSNEQGNLAEKHIKGHVSVEIHGPSHLLYCWWRSQSWLVQRCPSQKRISPLCSGSNPKPCNFPCFFLSFAFRSSSSFFFSLYTSCGEALERNGGISSSLSRSFA